jgi:phosphoglycerate dehydrogenase-like enzyme
MAEYVLAYTLSHYLQLPARARAQQRGEWMAQPTESLAGKCVGIMGTGSIGAAIAQRLAGLEARVLGFSRSGAPQDDFAQVFGPSGLPGFLASLDVLVAVLPDTPETAGLLNAETLRYLPQEALLINVGRGSLIVEQDLVDVMQAGHLAGAVLDVFQTEPLPLDHPFWRTPRLSLTAHVAARSWPRDIAAIFCDNLERYLAGRPLRHTLDPTRGY